MIFDCQCDSDRIIVKKHFTTPVAIFCPAAKDAAALILSSHATWGHSPPFS